MNKTTNYVLNQIRFNKKEDTVTMPDGKVLTSSEFLGKILEDNQNTDLTISVRGEI